MSNQILFILFLKDETDTDFIISLFNEFHILTDLLLIIFLIVLSELCITFNFLQLPLVLQLFEMLRISDIFISV